MNSVLSKSEGFQGTLSNIQLIDLLQMTCLSRISINIRVEGDGKEGLIQVFNGNIIHAESDGRTGENAFFDIMSWKGGNFHTSSMTDVPSPTIEKNWEFLLIEATKMQDETSRSTSIHQEEKNVAADSLLKILIVDDSKFICKKMQEMIETDPQLKVIGTAHNGKEALQKISLLNPDLITLDINMPVMGGDTALKHIMIKSPRPVVIVSSVDPSSTLTTFDYIRLGAVDFIAKPKSLIEFQEESRQFTDRLKTAARAIVPNFRRVKSLEIRKSDRLPTAYLDVTKDHFVFILGETGSCAEILKIIPKLPLGLNCFVLTVLKIDKAILGGFTRYLQKYSNFRITSLDNKAVPLKKECCAVTSYVRSVTLSKESNIAKIEYGEACESVEEFAFSLYQEMSRLFTSLNQSTWLVLSGESKISDKVLIDIKEKEGTILAQDPLTALYPALPASCIDTGLCDAVLPSEQLVGKLISLVQPRNSSSDI